MSPPNVTYLPLSLDNQVLHIGYKTRTALFWVILQRVMVILYRRFGGCTERREGIITIRCEMVQKSEVLICFAAED